MNRRSGWILFALGLVLAIGAGVMVYIVLQQQAATAAEEARQQAIAQMAPAPTVQMPVASRSIGIGAALTPEDVTLREFPIDLVPSTAFTSTAELESRVATRPIGEGELFFPSQFIEDERTSISPQIPEGRVLFAFPIIDLLGQSNLLRDGDRIDLLLTTPLLSPDGQSTGATTMLTLQNIEIFRVLRSGEGDEEFNSPATALMISVTPEDAVMLKFIKDSGGIIDFTLRSSLDVEDTFDPPSITQEELVDRYVRPQ